MDKEEYKQLRYDKDPIFDKDYIVKNMYCIYTQTAIGKNIFMYHLHKDGYPCLSMYNDDIKHHTLTFQNMEELAKWMEKLKFIYDKFSEWMEIYEKDKAKKVDINTKL